MKIRSAYKLIIGSVLSASAVYGGYQLYAAWRVDGLKFDPIAPGRVNLVAVNPGVGYRIIVANQIAQLAEVVGGAFDSPEVEVNSAGEAQGETTNRKRIPIREMLQSLQGDEQALSYLVMRLNDKNEQDLPSGDFRVLWTADDIARALAGDEKLVKKLEYDLNIRLDGRPLDYFRLPALENGIVLKLPVTVNVNVAGERRDLTAYVLEQYRPRLMVDVEKRYENRVDVNNNMIRGYYAEEAAKLAESNRYEDIKGVLRDLTAKARLQEFAQKPERLLRNTTIVLNDQFVQQASYEVGSEAENKKMYKLSLDVSNEGRDRLWKYSRQRPGFQLLLIVDGVAIAAPRISTELAQHNVVINNLPDEVLVREAVRTITEAKKRGGSS